MRVVMKTMWKNFWEKDGTAPFSSKNDSGASDLLNYKNQCPIDGIGIYIKDESEKKASDLRINRIFQIDQDDMDIKVDFKFLGKSECSSRYIEEKIKKKGFVIIWDDPLESPLLSYRCINDRLYTSQNWKDFERKSALLFHMIGFDVEVKGHLNPMERTADFCCYSPPNVPSNRICIVGECKHKSEYSMNTEDERAIKEYIENEKSSVYHRKGVPVANTFFLLISKGFTREVKVRINNISKVTNAFGASITFDNLLYLVERRVKQGFKFNIALFQKLFENDEILPMLIDKIYPVSDEFHLN